MYVNTCFSFFFEFQYNYKNSNAGVTFPGTKYKSKNNKASFLF